MQKLKEINRKQRKKELEHKLTKLFIKVSKKLLKQKCNRENR